ncbi:TetR/AcrR family transcriptional regulator C-terminal domain-containing protein [Frigoribacterium sp. PhB24]|uniref:TetR/AcrR family transcriptional regulator C-terminal domain-containing protein n=1 Tax=Frigoribacterium sp. PhB24 TaxID=2485204 RepID=UPI000FC0EFF9|nr:TetR/AcrR family transcriptional regulator C-terminal domain-containing protein [Frigoribacterium sp. PhB24]ROS48908.1 TetR family transcriptional regulator [Frigoribacterium sp. PhB24]
MSTEYTARRRGRPPRIDREQILAVARHMDPEVLTMRAVAGALGVDPSALNYHVVDREGLLDLLAADRLRVVMSGLSLPSDADWEITCRAYADQARAGILRAGTLSFRLRLPALGGVQTFEAVETVLQRLSAAGLSTTASGRILLLLNQVVFASARDAALGVQSKDSDTGSPDLARLLDDLPTDGLALSRQALATWDPASDEQFQFGVDIVVDGVAQAIRRAATRGA